MGGGGEEGHVGVRSGWDKRHVSKSSDIMQGLKHDLSCPFINSHHHDNTNKTT